MARKRQDRTKTRPKLVAQNVKRVRTRQGITQAATAELAGIHRVTLSNIESGVIGDIESETLISIARALGVPPAELLEDPLESAAIAPLIEEYLRAPIIAPEPEEVAWLLRRPTTFWFGLRPTPEVISQVLLLHRQQKASKT